MTIDGATVPTRRPALLDEELDGEVVIFNQGDASVHVLNGPGASIWTLIDGRRSVDAVIAEIESEYSGEVGTVRLDVVEFLRDLENRGLIQLTPGRPA